MFAARKRDVVAGEPLGPFEFSIVDNGSTINQCCCAPCHNNSSEQYLQRSGLVETSARIDNRDLYAICDYSISRLGETDMQTTTLT
jgi:hypothetical protein